MNRLQTMSVEEIPAQERYARAPCGNVTEADDLVQESQVRAIRPRLRYAPNRV